MECHIYSLTRQNRFRLYHSSVHCRALSVRCALYTPSNSLEDATDLTPNLFHLLTCATEVITHISRLPVLNALWFYTDPL